LIGQLYSQDLREFNNLRILNSKLSNANILKKLIEGMILKNVHT
jgi:hypothetical protein